MPKLLFVFMVLAAAPCVGASEQVPAIRIAGETKVKPHSLVRLRAEGVDAKAAILWRIHPSKDVQRATTPRGLLEFVAKPGVYEVELLVIQNTETGLQVDESRVTVEIADAPAPPTPPVPPKPEPTPPEGGKLDPVGALGRIRFGNAGCTATVVGPRRPDGRWDVLTAAHCVDSVGQKGTLTLKDGRTLSIRVVVHQRTPDVAWCVTDDAVADLPFAKIAEKNPDVGTPVWHMGYGVDRPGNREDGSIAAAENGQGQLRMVLSVSSGDSGGGIFRADTNELVSVVCCTSGMAKRTSMWGCSTEIARKFRPRTTEADDTWIPIPIPICRDADDVEDDGWRPIPIPVRPVLFSIPQ